MSLAVMFAEVAKAAPTSFEAWIAALDDADRASVMEYAADPVISHNAFLRVVKSAGARSGKDTVTAWRIAQGYSVAR